MRLSRETGTSKRTIGAVLTSSVLRFGVSAPLAIVVLPVALRRLSTAEYGVWAVLSVFLAIGYFAEAGIRTEMVRRIAEARGRDDDAAISRTLREGTTVLGALAVVVCGAGIALSGPLVRIFFHGHLGVPAGVNAVLVCRLVMVLLALSLLAAGAFAALEGLQRSDWDNYALATGNVLGAIVTLVGLLVHWGLWAFVAGAFTQFAACSAVRAFATRLVVRRLPRTPARLSSQLMRSYLGVSSLLVLSQVSNVFDYEFDKVLLARYVSSSTAGLYDVGTTLALQARAVALLPLLVLLPGVAELAQHQDGRALELYEGVRRAVVAGVIVLLGGVVVLGPSIVGVWIGPGHGQAGYAAQWLAGAMALNSVAAPAACYVIGRRWTKLTAIGSVVNIVVNSIGSLVLTQIYGLHGALIGSVAANAAATVVFLAIATRHERRLTILQWVWPATCGVAAVLLAMWWGIGRDVHGWLDLVARSALWLALSLVAVALSGAMRPLASIGRRLHRERAAVG